VHNSIDEHVINVLDGKITTQQAVLDALDMK
jgi:hypothetical protein